jgi:hypothetical protein
MKKEIIKKEKTVAVSEVSYKMTAIIRTGEYSNVNVEVMLTGTDLNALEVTAQQHIDASIHKYNNYIARMAEVAKKPVVPVTQAVPTAPVAPKISAFEAAKRALDSATDDNGKAFIVEQIKNSTKLNDAEKAELLK